MRISDIFLSNEERLFLKSTPGVTKLASLDERSKQIAQNLVKRGVLKLSKDRKAVIKNENAGSII